MHFLKNDQPPAFLFIYLKKNPLEGASTAQNSCLKMDVVKE